MEELLRCQRNGCGMDYKESENNDFACWYNLIYIYI